jgi:gluconolactonase
MSVVGGFSLRASDFSIVAKGLMRPECVLAERDGTLWASDTRAMVMRIDASGRQTLVGAPGQLPNGLAFDREGFLWVADIGAGCVLKLARDGRIERVYESGDGRRLTAANFVYADALGRIWLTLSTRTEPRSQAVQTPIPDGSLWLFRDGAFRLMAEGFHFTNEIRIDAAGKFLYVAETAVGGITRFTLAADGSLGKREAFGPRPLVPGCKVDGITFDVAGNLWVTDPLNNALIVVSPEGRAHEVMRDPSGECLGGAASLTFTGPDLRTAVIGSLRMNHLPAFRAPLAGVAMAHW